MRILKKEFKSKEVTIVPIGDIHLGTVYTDERLLNAAIRRVLDTDNCYALGMGDYGEFINISDKRFDPANLSPWAKDNVGNIAKATADRTIDSFKELAKKGKLLGMLAGNHEEKIRLKYHFDVQQHICDKLGVPNLSYNAFLQIQLHASGGTVRNLSIYACHGCKGGSSKAARLKAVEELMSKFDADVYLYAHNHARAITSYPTIYLDKMGHMKQRNRLLGLTGTYREVYVENSTDYGEKANYSPSDLGSVVIKAKVQGKYHDLVLRGDELDV